MNKPWPGPGRSHAGDVVCVIGLRLDQQAPADGNRRGHRYSNPFYHFHSYHY